MHQSMFAFVVVVANTVFAISDVTGYHQSTSPFTTSLPVVVHCRVRHLIVASQKVTTKSNDIWAGVTRKCNALPLLDTS